MSASIARSAWQSASSSPPKYSGRASSRPHRTNCARHRNNACRTALQPLPLHSGRPHRGRQIAHPKRPHESLSLPRRVRSGESTRLARAALHAHVSSRACVCRQFRCVCVRARERVRLCTRVRASVHTCACGWPASRRVCVARRQQVAPRGLPTALACDGRPLRVAHARRRSHCGRWWVRRSSAGSRRPAGVRCRCDDRPLAPSGGHFAAGLSRRCGMFQALGQWLEREMAEEFVDEQDMISEECVATGNMQHAAGDMQQTACNLGVHPRTPHNVLNPTRQSQHGNRCRLDVRRRARPPALQLRRRVYSPEVASVGVGCSQPSDRRERERALRAALRWGNSVRQEHRESGAAALWRHE